MKFLKKFLENLRMLITLFLFLGLVGAAVLAPACLGAIFNDAKWLLLYVIYGIPLFAFIVTLIEEDDE